MITNKINNFSVEPLKHSSDKRPFKYQNVLSEPFFNTFLFAKKKSGKSTLIYNLLELVANKHTVIRIFSTTYENDTTMIEMIKKLKK
jgi:hypothetical protein